MFIIVSGLVGYLARLDLIAVPISPGRAMVVLVMVSTIPALVAVPLLASPNAEWERCFPQLRLARFRMGWFVTLLVTPGLFQALSVLGSEYWEVQILWFSRNHALFLVLGAICAHFLPPRTAWLPLAGYALLDWFVGTSDAAATPIWWALPGYPPDSALAGIGAISCVVVGGIAQFVGAKSDH